MKTDTILIKTREKTIIRKCHLCGEIIEARVEPEKCPTCKKSFLPSNYFGKIHAKNSEEFKKLFSKVEEIYDESLIRGLIAIW